MFREGYYRDSRHVHRDLKPGESARGDDHTDRG